MQNLEGFVPGSVIDHHYIEPHIPLIQSGFQAAVDVPAAVKGHYGDTNSRFRHCPGLLRCSHLRPAILHSNYTDFFGQGVVGNRAAEVFGAEGMSSFASDEQLVSMLGHAGTST